MWYYENFLKYQTNWNTVYGAIQDLPWRNIWLADSPVEFLNEHLSLLVGRLQPRSSVWATRISRCLMISNRRLIVGGCVIALGITRISLSAVKCELMKPTRMPIVSLVTETGMFLLMSSPLTSGHCLRLLVRVDNRCVSQLVRLICCQIILTASSPGSLPLNNRLQVLSPLTSYHLLLLSATPKFNKSAETFQLTINSMLIKAFGR